jgi:fermentation-respiration switch protein FrsA (DUF1100 family)
MTRISIDREQIAGVPLLIIAPEGATGCPIVFFVHGFTATKADGVDFGYRLASAGMVCVCVDAAMHGDRQDPRLTQIFDPTVPHTYPQDSMLNAYIFQYHVTAQTAEDITRLISAFSQDARFDMSRVGVAGVSMGGLTAFYLAAHHPQVQVAVPMITIPHFAQYWDDAVLEASTNPAWASQMKQAGATLASDTAFVQQLDPMEQLRTFAPKPLLILLGANDMFAYKFGGMELYRQLTPSYRDHPERLKLHIYPGIAHDVTREMAGEACAWFRQYLY